MAELQPLHRLFGLSWMDFFQGTDVDVQMEIDLSLKQQFTRRGAHPQRTGADYATAAGWL